MKNARTVAVLVVCLALVCVAGGCAMLQRGPSDEELLKDLLCTYETSLNEANVEKLVALYSEDYESSDGADYEETVERLEWIVPRFEEWGVEISSEGAGIEIEGNEAEIGPIIFQSDRGEMVVTLSATKEDEGVWRITGSEREGE